MDLKILTYEEYLKELYENYFEIEHTYLEYLERIRHRIHIRMMWDKEDTSLASLLVRVEELIESRKQQLLL